MSVNINLIQKFSLKKNAKQVKFWGKIFTSEKDYYIIEGVADSAEEVGELAPDVEPKGVGVNRISYWATTSLTG
jgi:radial spoke head protein 4A